MITERKIKRSRMKLLKEEIEDAVEEREVKEEEVEELKEGHKEEYREEPREVLRKVRREVHRMEEVVEKEVGEAEEEVDTIPSLRDRLTPNHNTTLIALLLKILFMTWRNSTHLLQALLNRKES